MTDRVRRRVLQGAAVAGAAAMIGSAAAQVSSDQAPKVLDGKPMPEPPPERSAGPIRPGRGSILQDKVAVVTGAARGIGRAIAVEMAPTAPTSSSSTLQGRSLRPRTPYRPRPSNSTRRSGS
jgi:hypothetical protein